jgi:hypothetical protein
MLTVSVTVVRCTVSNVQLVVYRCDHVTAHVVSRCT